MLQFLHINGEPWNMSELFFAALGSEAFGGARRWLVRRDGLADHPKSGAAQEPLKLHDVTGVSLKTPIL